METATEVNLRSRNKSRIAKQNEQDRRKKEEKQRSRIQVVDKQFQSNLEYNFMNRAYRAISRISLGGKKYVSSQQGGQTSFRDHDYGDRIGTRVPELQDRCEVVRRREEAGSWILHETA